MTKPHLVGGVIGSFSFPLMSRQLRMFAENVVSASVYLCETQGMPLLKGTTCVGVTWKPKGHLQSASNFWRLYHFETNPSGQLGGSQDMLC